MNYMMFSKKLGDSVTIENIFTTEDICTMIKTCSTNGVREFKYLGLKFSFVPVQQPPSQDPVYVPEAVRNLTLSQAREAQQREEIKYKSEELDLMQIEDPLRYEQLIKAGDITDEET